MLNHGWQNTSSTLQLHPARVNSHQQLRKGTKTHNTTRVGNSAGCWSARLQHAFDELMQSQISTTQPPNTYTGHGCAVWSAKLATSNEHCNIKRTLCRVECETRNIKRTLQHQTNTAPCGVRNSQYQHQANTRHLTRAKHIITNWAPQCQFDCALVQGMADLAMYGGAQCQFRAC